MSAIDELEDVAAGLRELLSKLKNGIRLAETEQLSLMQEDYESDEHLANSCIHFLLQKHGKMDSMQNVDAVEEFIKTQIKW